MNSSVAPQDFFVAGGTLKPEVQSYVKRPADDELYNLALSGKFCFVLTPRQMGKSSLMIRTARRLQAHGVSAAIIDLTQIGAEVTADEWYLSLLAQLKRRLGLAVDVEAWWQARAAFGAAQCLTDFMRDVVLKEITGKVVVFIDEIDTTLKFSFRDDFFAAIRAMYNARADESQFERLTFVLLGVASPSDLIKDRVRTPFNIGQGIALQEFSRADATVLQTELECLYPGQGEAILDRIFHWTNGHPYLTQKLCLAVAESRDDQEIDERIDALVAKLFLAEEARKETNLQFVQDKVLTHPQRRALLNLYGRVAGGMPVTDDGQSPLQSALKLSGLVKVENGRLRVRNEIYRRAFGLAWVKENTPVNRPAIVAGIASGVAVAAIALIAIILFGRPPQTCRGDNFSKTTDAGQQLACLSRLIQYQSPLGQVDYYDYEAKQLFYGLPREQQLALFKVTGRDADLVAVVKGLYVTLADVSDTESNTPLLTAMADALNRSGQTGDAPRLSRVIGHWVMARGLARQKDYAAALGEYNSAVALIDQAKDNPNPAILYERARLYITQPTPKYAEALADLETIVRMARSAPTPTPPPATATRAQPQPTVAAETPKPAEGILPVPTPAARVSPISTPTGFATPAPTPVPPATGAFLSEFTTFGQMVEAVRNLIYSYPGATQALVDAQANYANLRQLTPSAGSTMISKQDGMVLVYVPAGKFLMGSTNADVDAALAVCKDCPREKFTGEQPQREVYLDAFWIDRTEVTNAQYNKCVRAGKCTASSYANDTKYNGDNQPVVGVDWNDAKSYCEWAGRHLPTEAQWEKAARGMDGSIYPWGNTPPDPSRLNFNGQVGKTTEVGKYPTGASPYGALDMAGNVWEWTSSLYKPYPYQADDGREDISSSGDRVRRGGAFRGIETDARAAFRHPGAPLGVSETDGFRCGADGAAFPFSPK